MPLSKKIFTTALLSLLTACAPALTAPPETAEQQLRSAPRTYSPQALTDAGQGLRTALELYKSGNFEAVLVVCRQVEELYPETAWYQRSLFLVERALIQLDRAGEADAVMLRLQAEYPEMADYAVSILADYHFAKARYTQAAVLYQQVAERYPRSSLAERAAYQRARALLESFFALPAIEAFENFLRDHPRSEFASDSALGLGRALLADARPDEQEILKGWLSVYGKKGKLQHYHAPGCAVCEDSGLKGRAGLHELLTVSKPMRRLIQTGGRVEEMQAVALGDGMRTLRQDGITKVLMGITTIEEVRATSNA